VIKQRWEENRNHTESIELEPTFLERTEQNRTRKVKKPNQTAILLSGFSPFRQFRGLANIYI